MEISSIGARLSHLFLQVLRRWNRYSKLSFGLEGEDLILSKIAKFSKSQRGFFVDVGAHHPFRFSNTALFYLHGWRGVNIDPTPGAIERFRKMRPRDINLDVAISEDESVRNFYIYSEAALNGIDCDRSEELAGTGYRLINTIPVRTVPLAKVLKQHLAALPKPNFLTVDAEGHDLEVLRSNDWDRFPFEWVLAELQLDDASHLGDSPIATFLDHHGYCLRAFTGRTGIFSKV